MINFEFNYLYRRCKTRSEEYACRNSFFIRLVYVDICLLLIDIRFIKSDESSYKKSDFCVI